MKIISIGKDSGGIYFAHRGLRGKTLSMHGLVDTFTLTQNDGESVSDFEERVRQEARRRGIEHVKNLDD